MPISSVLLSDFIFILFSVFIFVVFPRFATSCDVSIALLLQILTQYPQFVHNLFLIVYFSLRFIIALV